jgi:cell division protein FtsB
MPSPKKRTMPADAEPGTGEEIDPSIPAGAPTPAAAAALGSLSDLPVAGLTRRRIALLLGALVAAWVIVLFARQVSEASEASSRAAEMRASNTALVATVNALKDELSLIQRQEYIQQQAREYRLGDTRELPFILADDAPALPAGAPGSAAARLGATVNQPTPLDSWLDLLFGPNGDPASPMESPAN